MLQCCQECVVNAPWVSFALRPNVAEWIYVAICADDLGVDELTPSKYLAFKEKLKSTLRCKTCAESALKHFPLPTDCNVLGAVLLHHLLSLGGWNDVIHLSIYLHIPCMAYILEARVVNTAH